MLAKTYSALQSQLLERDIDLLFAIGRQVDLSGGRLDGGLCEREGGRDRVEALAASGCAIKSALTLPIA